VNGYFLTNDGTNLSWGANGMGDLLANGTVPLTADWANPLFGISAKNLTATPTLGAELITGATAMSTWTDVADWSYASAKWTHAATGATALVSNWQPTANIEYKITVTIVHTSGTGVVVSCGGQTYASVAATSTFYLTALSTAALTFTPSANWIGDITAVSVMAETNGLLTATNATITNGLTVNSGQLLLPYGDATHLPLAFTATSGMYYDAILHIKIGGVEPLLIYSGVVYIGDSTELSFGTGGDTALLRTVSGGIGLKQRQITAGAGTGLTVSDAGSLNRQVYKVTVDYTGFSAAALTADHTIATLPAKTKIVGFYADTTTPFTGGTVSAASLIVGKTAGGVEYIATHDVLSAAIMRGLADADMGTELVAAALIQGGAVMNWTGTTTVIARLTTVTANTNALTAGSTTFYIVTERF
jgi:hypothetical protein